MAPAYYRIDDIVGESRRISDLRDLLRKISFTDTNVLITGESGCGKELIAQALHNLSPRKDFPFVAVNCGAIPRELIESELFGFSRGAFTGAVSDYKGKFLSADRGTIFLDEIGELPFDMQAKLLRVIEEKVVSPIGSGKETEIDFRLICATNRDLREMAENHEFRRDLYFRINTVLVNAPPLAQRKEDIPILMNHFLNIYTRKLNRRLQLKFSERVIAAFSAYNWPGNVRELENTVEREVIFAGENSTVIDHISEQISSNRKMASTALPVLNLSSLEKLAVAQAVQDSQNLSEAAEKLGISRATLYRKLREHGLEN